jgi:hypothetical protein
VQFDHPPLQWHIPIPHPNPPLQLPHPDSSSQFLIPFNKRQLSQKSKSHKKGQVLGLEAKNALYFYNK